MYFSLVSSEKLCVRVRVCVPICLVYCAPCLRVRSVSCREVVRERYIVACASRHHSLAARGRRRSRGLSGSEWLASVTLAFGNARFLVSTRKEDKAKHRISSATAKCVWHRVRYVVQCPLVIQVCTPYYFPFFFLKAFSCLHV